MRCILAIYGGYSWLLGKPRLVLYQLMDLGNDLEHFMATLANTIAIVHRNLRPEGPILSAQVRASAASGGLGSIRDPLDPEGGVQGENIMNGPFRASIISHCTQASARCARSDLG